MKPHILISPSDTYWYKIDNVYMPLVKQFIDLNCTVAAQSHLDKWYLHRALLFYCKYKGLANPSKHYFGRCLHNLGFGDSRKGKVGTFASYSGLRFNIAFDTN